MKGYARIYTDAISKPKCSRHGVEGEHCNRYCTITRERKRTTGESRLIALQKQLEHDRIPYVTEFGLNGETIIRWGTGIEVETEEAWKL